MPRSAKKDDSIIIKQASSSKLDRFDKEGNFAGRFPTSWIAREAKVEGGAGFTGKNNNAPYGSNGNKGNGLVDPYNTITKNRFEDCARADGAVQNGILFLVKTILGKKHEVVLDAREQYTSEELRKQAMESIMGNAEYQKMVAQINEIDSKVKLHERLMSSQFQKYIFGRSALAVVIKNGLPVELKQLSSKNLGQVYINKDWSLKGIGYNDSLLPGNQSKQEPDLMANEILYFTNMDYNITPNTLFYGQSKIEGVAHASETKRIIIEEDMKELAKSSWAEKYILPVPGVTSSSKLTEIANGLDPNRINVVNQDIGQPVIFPSSNKYAELMQVVRELDQYIARGMGIPNMFVGFEDVQNHATAQEVMTVFKATTIEFERSVLQSQLDAQWYQTLVETLTGQNAEELEWQARMEYVDIVFDTVKDEIEKIRLLEEIGVPLPIKEKLERLGMEHLIDEVTEMEEQKKEEEIELMKTQAELKGGINSADN